MCKESPNYQFLFYKARLRNIYTRGANIQILL
jgi:hypothetical protein